MATDVLQKISDTFWSESFWLPANATWKDIVSKRESGEMYLPLPGDLWAPFPIAVILFIVRLLWERFIALPLGRYYNISESPPRIASPNAVLDQAFKKYGKHAPKHDIVVGLAKQTDMTTRNVERWWRRKNSSFKPSEMQRFKETTWRFLFYCSAFWYGVIILWNKPYFWDTRHCWYDYPYQHIPSEVYWYYMIELGFYWSLVLSLFMDIKRKDFVEMIIHHIATIGLMMFSWSDNMVRIGTLVLVVHDAVDPILEGAKLTKYCKYNRLCDALFVSFAVMWFISRIVVYPIKILHATAIGSWTQIGPYQSYYLFNGLLFLLQVLHIIWFYMIMRMAIAFVLSGKVEKDVRSDTEQETTEDEDDSSKPLKESPDKQGANNNVGKTNVNGTKANGVQHRKK